MKDETKIVPFLHCFEVSERKNTRYYILITFITEYYAEYRISIIIYLQYNNQQRTDHHDEQMQILYLPTYLFESVLKKKWDVINTHVVYIFQYT